MASFSSNDYYKVVFRIHFWQGKVFSTIKYYCTGSNYYETVTIPAIVFKNIRYSKFEISLFCHLAGILDFLNSCNGDAREIDLQMYILT